MKEIVGDLIYEAAVNGRFDVIVHGCNCFHTMGAGIARQLSKTFPEVLVADKKTPYQDLSKLGSYSSVTIKHSENEFIVINAYTQFTCIGPKPVDIDAIRKVFRKIKKDFSGLRIGYPKIGAGLAGGDWNEISKIINEELEGEDHTLVIWKG